MDSSIFIHLAGFGLRVVIVALIILPFLYTRQLGRASKVKAGKLAFFWPLLLGIIGIFLAWWCYYRIYPLSNILFLTAGLVVLTLGCLYSRQTAAKWQQ